MASMRIERSETWLNFGVYIRLLANWGDEDFVLNLNSAGA
jgi:hypothetical protein